jgi:hypothetical protein
MTRRAREIGFFTVETPDTAPHLLLLPSMILASISTVPFAVRADPRPELNQKKNPKINKNRKTNYRFENTGLKNYIIVIMDLIHFI